MKKTLIILLIVLLVALNGYILFQGFDIGEIKILGIIGIQEKDALLETQISKITKLASTDYKKEVAQIDTNIQNLEKEKQKYEDMVTVSVSDEVQKTGQLEKYDIDYLWTRIGNHATSEGVIIKMEITNGTNIATQNIKKSETTSETEEVAETEKEDKQTTQESTNSSSSNGQNYNLNFTVTGAYVGIADFIYAIENDSSLGFKIEEFKMVSELDGGTNLRATFVCKDVAIKNISQISSSITNTEETNKNNTNTKNSTNNTNSTNNSNSNTSNNNTNTSNNNTNTSNNTNT